MPIPNRIRERIVTGLKRLIPIIQQQKTRDISEADTVTLVKDILSEALGYDKYTELTSEHGIRGIYCDLAMRTFMRGLQNSDAKRLSRLAINRSTAYKIG